MVHFQGSSWLTKQKGIALKTKLISKEQPGPSRISLNKLLLIYLHWLKTPLLSFSKGSELHNKHLQRLRLLPKKKKHSREWVRHDAFPKTQLRPSSHWDKKTCSSLSLERQRIPQGSAVLLLCSVLSWPQHQPDHYLLPTSLLSFVGSLWLNLGSQACSLLPATLTWMCQWAELQQTETRATSWSISTITLSMGFWGTALLDLTSYPRQG